MEDELRDLLDELEHTERVWNREYGLDYELDEPEEKTRSKNEEAE